MNGFENILKNKKEPVWLLKFRQENLQLFYQLDYPRDDEWKYTSFDDISLEISSTSSINIKSKNCKIEKSLDLFKNMLSKPKNKFEALNNAVFHEAKVIYANNNSEIEIFFDKQNFVKLFVFAKGNVNIKQHLNLENFSIIQTYIFVNGKANLSVLDLSDQKAVVINENFVNVERNGEFFCNFGIFGGRLNRFKVESRIMKNGTNKIKGVFFGNNSQHFNLATTVLHAEEASNNDILVKGVLNDSATSSFFGLIDVAKQAKKANSYLASHVLVLSENAKSNTIPSLKIYTDDAKAKHASTISTLDEERLFYMMTRGLDANTAQKMIVSAFLTNAEEINSQNLQKIIEGKML
ncbi:MAG: SufD family Fe-S cluster assembly protein [Candidatus Aenigmarchaeota archaeon]|nr:SufD family Fe-S cluster assembly protein [Candidatus Aenigmarchaeota archaeon]MCX8179528.1 SufD family Fe-S cluster assembly protein [Candidatus Aenigmarchaeota archaeon]